MFSNKKLKGYYLYNFLISAVDTGSGNFTMVYFYLHGMPTIAVLGAMFTYSLTCLVILKPVGILIEKIGPQKVFYLSAVTNALKYFAILSIFVFPTHDLVFFLLWQFFNGFNVMFSRIPLNSYFSAYGDNDKRGSQIGLVNNIQILASAIVPILAGALIEKTGIIIITTITTAVNILATFVLKFDDDVKIKDPVQFKNLYKNFPKPFTKAFFFNSLVNPFTADLLSIYIAITLNSFTVLGIFIGLRTAVNIFLNYFVGHLTDRSSIKLIFFISIFVSSLFYIILPFIHVSSTLFLLQFTLGLASLIISIPFESAYHNVAKKSENPIQFALWREVAKQTGLVLGSGLTILALYFGVVTNWQLLLPLGSVSALAMLFILSYISKVKSLDITSSKKVG